MKLTGKCKKEFDLYLINDKAKIGYNFDNYDVFYFLPDALQIGVLILYFDSVGIIIGFNTWNGHIYPTINENEISEPKTSHKKAWLQVVKNADEKRNKQLKK